MVAKYTENTPGVTPEHLALLERKRASWHKCYGPKKRAKDYLVRTEFLATYPNWYELRDDLPELWRVIVECYFGIDTERLNLSQIGNELPLEDNKTKPRSRQAIHQLLKKALERLEALELDLARRQQH